MYMMIFADRPLHLAVKENDIKIVELLLKNSVPVNIKIKYHVFDTPIPKIQENLGKTPVPYGRSKQ